MVSFAPLVLAAALAPPVEPPSSITLTGPSYAGAASAPAADTVPDSWGPRIRLRAPDGWFATPIHATLMPDGRVLCIGYERELEDPGVESANRKASFFIDPLPLGAPAPVDHVVESLAPPYDATTLFVPPWFVDDTLFCAGNTLTADGELFTAGGTRGVFDLVTGDVVSLGLPYAMRFDGADWTRVPNDLVGVGAGGLNSRWYTTTTRLPDERILVTSGFDSVLPTSTLNLTAEIYDPADDSFQLFSGLTETPLEVFNPDYTHAFVLPEPVGSFDLVMFGQAGTPVLASTDGPVKWAPVPSPRPGTLPGQAPNHGASSALLPIRLEDGEWGYSNGSVLMTSGEAGSSHMRFADVFDPVALEWKKRVNLGVMRHHPSTVLLPDGRVLVVAGHNLADLPDLRRNAYFDPRNPRGAKLGTDFSDEVRGYHNIAVLLPDGRVLVGGGRDLDTTNGPAEKSDMRYYSPDYMFAPNRPRITDAPESLNLGGNFFLRTSRKIEEVALVALGSMTHSVDMNQRHVELELLQSFKVPGGQFHVVSAPEDARIAPPGHYMLFALDKRRVPSEARIVRVR